MNKGLSLDLSKVMPYADFSEIEKMEAMVKCAHETVHEGTGAGNDFLGWLDLPVNYDKAEFDRIKKAAEKIKSDSDVLVVIGIGGSYLGARAAIEMLKNHFYNVLDNSKRKAPQVFFVGNNISSTYVADLLEVIEGKDISLKYVPGKQVEKLIKGQNPFLWIESLWKGRNMKAKIGVEYDESALKTQIANLECMKEENQIAPVNAHPEFKTDKFVVVPETDGTTIKTEEFRKTVITAVNGANEKLDLLKTGCYEKPAYTSDSKKVTEACDAMNKYLGATVTYDFKPNTEVVDSSMISKWVKVDDDMNVTFDESAVKEYVQSLAAKYDTKGKERTFTSASGNTVTVSGGSYGWKIDQEAEYNALIANIQKAETVTREPNYSSRAASHDGNDVGNTYAEVNLTTQHMYYVKDGHIALETDVVTGNPNKGNATPTGVYSLAYKAKDQTLKGTKKADGTYEYETPVKYWMPFNGGVGFHDASWQPTFGGSRYQTNGSHGCVNMPPEMAGKLFELISAGTPVVVHN